MRELVAARQAEDAIELLVAAAGATTHHVSYRLIPHIHTHSYGDATYLSVEQSEQKTPLHASHSRRQHSPTARSQCEHCAVAAAAGSRRAAPFCVQTAQQTACFGASDGAAWPNSIATTCFFIRALVTAADIIRLIASANGDLTASTPNWIESQPA